MAIGRFVFGDETKDQKIKTMGLSSEVDVVQDDAIPAIHDAMARNGCPVRNNRSSNLVTTSRSSMVSSPRKIMVEVVAQQSEAKARSSFKPSFC